MGLTESGIFLGGGSGAERGVGVRVRFDIPSSITLAGKQFIITDSHRAGTPFLAEFRKNLTDVYAASNGSWILLPLSVVLNEISS